MVELAGLIGEELLQFNPSLDVREVQELLVPVPSLRLQGDEAHRLTDEDELLCLRRALSHRLATGLLIHHELAEVLLREFNSFGCFVTSDKLNDL